MIDKTKPGVYIFDMDEVLVNISPPMYRVIRANWRKYNRWFKDLGPLTDEQILARDNFYVDEWLIKDEIKNLPEEEFKEVKSVIFKFLLNDFFNDPKLYDALIPTEMARGTLMNPMFIDSDRVKKVYILTRYIPAATNMKAGKERFVKKFFDHPKIEMILVPSKKKKSDAIKEKGINWNVLVDDELRNIDDFIENMDIEGKEFIIPAFGYNKMDPIRDIIIKEKGGVYSYY